MQQIPKIIYVYWNDKELPPFIQKTLHTITHFNKDWEVKLFCYDDILKIDDLPKFVTHKSNLIHVQKDLVKFISDWLRLYLLYNHGGVYIDISCICFQNFSSIIDVNDDRLYGYDYPSDDITCMENWFLASPPKNEFVKKWLAETIIARNDDLKYSEKNYMFAPKLNHFLPYLNQHLAWKKINDGMTSQEKNKQYKLIAKAHSNDGPYFYVDMTKSSKQINIHRLLSLSHPPKNAPFAKLNQSHRSLLQYTTENIKNMQKYKNSYVLKILNMNNVNLHNQSRELQSKKINIEQIYFIHIPKTAGTSMEHIFYEKKGCIGSCFFNKLHKKDILNNTMYNNVSLWHIPLQYFKQSFINNIISNYTIFTIVRNPYERIISDFKFWIQFYDARQNIRRKLKHNEKYLLNQIEKIYDNNFVMDANNLNQFINSILKNNKYMTQLDGHHIPMYYYLTNNDNNIMSNVHILKHENLNDDFNDFIRKNNLQIPSNVARDYKTNVSKNTLSVQNINDKNVKLINKIYKKDFALFNYEKL